MPLKGGSSMTIRPCYDGHSLTGMNQVAGDGLSVISIKMSHRNCKFNTDPTTNKPRISCTQGIKARNSFWNLHKPDLRKVRGLGCTTTDSVMQLLRNHNPGNAGKLSYKKRVLGLLGSMVTKRPKITPEPEVLSQKESWPAHLCVLSSVCPEAEMKVPSIISSQEKLKSIVNLQEEDILNDRRTIASAVNKANSDTVFISLPLPTNTLTNSSDNTFTKIEEETILLNEHGSNLRNIDKTSFLQSVSEGFPLENKESIQFISITPQDENTCITDYYENFTQANEANNQTLMESTHNETQQSELTDTILLTTVEENKIKGDKNLTDENDKTNLELKNSLLSDHVLKEDSSQVVQSIFSDILREMQEIEEYISSYISSVCTQEEEFENYQALNKKPSEVVSHFIEEIHSGLKLKNLQENNYKTSDLETKNITTNDSGYETKNEVSHEDVSYYFSYDDVPEYKCTKLEERDDCDKNNYKETNSTNKIILTDASAPEPLPDYCCWEDTDGTLIKPNSQNNYVNCLKEENNLMKKRENKSLLPATLIEEVWRLFNDTIKTQSILDDLINRYTVGQPSSYGTHWANACDPNVIEETGNIVYLIDKFISGACLPDQENGIRPNILTLIEIENDSFENISNNIFSQMTTELDAEDIIPNNLETTELKNPKHVDHSFKEEANSNDHDKYIKTETANVETEMTINAQDELGLVEIATSQDYESKQYYEQSIKRSAYSMTDETNKNSLNLGERQNLYEDCSDSSDEKLNTEIKFNYSFENSPNDLKTNGDTANENDTSLINEQACKIREVTNVPRQEKVCPLVSLQENDSNSGRSRLVLISDHIDRKSDDIIPRFIFSSPKVQLNLTNPLLKQNKK